MKKTILLSLGFTLLAFNNLYAQTPQFQNSGFENWTSKTAGGFDYSEPNNWFTLNALVRFGFDETTYKGLDAHSGLSCAIMESAGNAFADLPGLVLVNNIIDASGEPDLAKNKIAFDGRPNSLEFWFKSKPEDGDSSAVSLILTKWNSSKGYSDTIGIAEWSNGTAITTYTKASINVTYLSGLKPDSVFFIASSSLDGFNPLSGSKFWLDDINLNYAPTSVSEITNSSKIELFPNPCKEMLQIVSAEQLDFVQIYDELGRLVIDAKLTKYQVDIASLEPGIYFICVGSNQNNLAALPKKFIKE